MIFKKAAFAALLTFVAAQLTAQVNKPQEKGYLVLQTSDTIRGFIHYENSKELYKRVRFQESLSAPVRNYGTASVKAFYLAESRQLFISGDLLGEFKQGDYSGSQGVFLKALVRGPACLYHSAASKTSYYVTTEQRAEVLQKGNEKGVQIAGSYYTVESKLYLNKLQYLFSDCLKDTLSLPFSSYRLIEVVERYNSCKGSPSFRSGKRKNEVYIGFTAGVLSSDLSFADKKAFVRPYGYPSLAPYGSYDLTPLTNENSSSNAFFGGLSLSIYPGWNKHISLSTQIAYTQRNWSAERVKLDLKYLDIPLAVRYNFNIRKKIQPVIGAGLNLALNLNSMPGEENFTWSFHRVSYRRPGDTFPDVMEITMPSIFEKEFKPTMFFPFASIGAAFVSDRSIISFDYKMGFGASVTKSSLYNSSVTNQSFLITYTPVKWF